MVVTTVESGSPHRSAVTALDVVQTPPGLTGRRRLYRPVDTGHLLEQPARRRRRVGRPWVPRAFLIDKPVESLPLRTLAPPVLGGHSAHSGPNLRRTASAAASNSAEGRQLLGCAVLNLLGGELGDTMCLVGSLTLELLADLANLVHSPLEGRSDDGLDIQPSTASASGNEATADNRKVELLVKLAVVGAYGAYPVLRLTRRTTRLHVDASQGTGRVAGGTLLNTNREGRL